MKSDEKYLPIFIYLKYLICGLNSFLLKKNSFMKLIKAITKGVPFSASIRNGKAKCCFMKKINAKNPNRFPIACQMLEINIS